jgi:phage-related protein
LIEDIISIADNIIKSFPQIVSKITASLSDVMKTIGSSLLGNITTLSTDISESVFAVAENLKQFIESDGLKVLLAGITSLFVSYIPQESFRTREVSH